MKKEIFNLKNTNSLITGAGGLLGPEHAICLAEYGSNIILVDIDKINLKKAEKKIRKINKNAKINSFQVDISNENAVIELSKKLLKMNIKINILINNAALDPKMSHLDKTNGMIENYKIEDLKREIDVGLVGSFICSKVFGSLMAKNKGGSIINIASDLAILAPDQRVYSKNNKIESVKSFKPIGYPIVKSGMLGLNRYLATYWAHKNIRVNCLVPGAVLNKQSKHLIKQIESRVPLSRLAKKNEYRGAIIFLASTASSYMTGQILVMDGGRSIW